MNKWEIENRIQELNQKLDYLKEKLDNNNYSAYGTDVKYEYETRTRGSKSEIESIEKELFELNAKLNEINSYNKMQEKETYPRINKIEQERKKQQELKLLAQKKEKERLETFKKVKQIYKKTKGHGFTKLTDRIFGNGPKWGNVKNYSQEELDYVLKTLQGETNLRKTSIRKVEEKNLSFKETQSKIKNGNWNKFTRLLNSEHQLKMHMDNEEALERSGLNR